LASGLIAAPKRAALLAAQPLQNQRKRKVRICVPSFFIATLLVAKQAEICYTEM